MARQTAAALREAFGPAGVWVGEVAPDGRRIARLAAAGFGVDGHGADGQGVAGPAADGPAAADPPVLVPDPAMARGAHAPLRLQPVELGDRLPEFGEPDPRSAGAVLVRLWGGGAREPVGLVAVLLVAPARCGEDDLGFLAAVGELAGAALHRERLVLAVGLARGLVAEAARRAERIGLLAAALAAALSVDDVAGVLAEQVQTAVACDTFSLRFILPDEGVARAVRFGGAPMGYRDRFGDVRLDLPSAVAEVAATSAPVFLCSAAENQRRYGPEASVNYEAARIEGLARLPLMVEGQLVGILSVGYWHEQEFPPEERLFLTTVADLAAQALGRAMRTERLRQLQDLSDIALSRLSLAELAADLGQRLASMLGAAEVSLYLYDPARLALDPVPVATGRSVSAARGLLGQVLALREAVVVEDTGGVPDTDLDPRWRRFGSLALVPLVLNHTVTGVLVIARASPGPFVAADLELVDLASARFAVALDRSQAFETQRRLARTLQSTLLPPALPTIPGLELAARYEAAGAGMAVGGDFYDVFATAGGAWLLVIGDVRGRGPAAAALTGLIRHTIRAVAAEEGRPAGILQRLNTVLHNNTEAEDFATVACVRLEPRAAGVDLVVASAGHCQPQVVRTAGEPGSARVEALDVAGTLLGAFEDIVVEERAQTLGVGDVLVLHTDGVTEAAGTGGRFGDERLVRHLERAAGRRAEQIVAAVHTAVLDFTGGLAHDDLAIVAVGAVAAGDVHGVLLDRRLPHTAAAPALARRLLDHLVPVLGEGELLEAMRLAVSEMVTNAVRHAPAYDDVVLRVTRNPHCVRVEVQNTGQPFVPPAEPPEMAEHGRGLIILGHVSARTGVGSDGERTLVWCEFEL